MPAATIYSFLVGHGLWNDAVFAVVGAVIGGALAKTWATIHGFHPLKVWQEHAHTQKQIADALDTSTPGGLTDLVGAINQETREKQT